MKGLIFGLIFLVFYIVAFALILARFLKVEKYPEKFENAELEQQSEQLVRECRKGNRVSSRKRPTGYNLLGFGLGAILTALSYLFVVLIQKFVFVEGIQVNTAWRLVALFFSAVPCFVLGSMIIPLETQTPFGGAMCEGMLNVEGRVEMFRRSYLILLISFLVTCPFFYLSCSNYTYFNENGLYSSTFFKLDEVEMRYEEIKNVSICVKHNNSGKVDCVYYEVKLNNGQYLNINNANNGCKRIMKETLVFHNRLLKKGKCDFKIQKPSQEDLSYFSEILSEEDYNNFKYVFNV